MIKTTLSILGLSLVSTLALAADPLHGTKWKTIDDVTKKPLSVVQFTETSNGVLSAKIVDVLEDSESQKCSKCKGKFYNKPLQGIQIVTGLKKTGTRSYDGGKITDPKNGKTYSFNAKLSEDGKTLSGRGYIGVSALGRSQTWIRTN
ncbi:MULTISPECIES: DUF2147 domain-containing protein [unclassified Acinetobacter]|uniref:DUF2147 domain-containing protein n=1 Tax=unclassified Acinetobacter TaxID=196816 RepID=UPI0012189CA4|nr:MULTISPECIES: DUF2147 domain-containing protein [unclassified Acinetobacter]RZJ21549.1 MAG: DUF2147 domain-containing protein [Acinetobacter sp.]